MITLRAILAAHRSLPLSERIGGITVAVLFPLAIFALALILPA